LKVGYSRVSTQDQQASYEAQQYDLKQAGCDKIFAEKVSSVAKRDQLDGALQFVRQGDCLVVTQLDRLARSTKHFLEINDQLDAKGVALRILNFGGSALDTQSATGKMLLVVTAAVAEFERSLSRERMLVGIAKAKAEGKYRGRAPTARRKTNQIVQLRATGCTPSEIANETGVSRSSVYRILADAQL